MKTDLRMYGQEFNPEVMKDIEKINNKLETEQDSEEILKLKLQRLYRGMEIGYNYNQRNPRTLFPY